MLHKRLLVLGTRGIPNNYGGFETFAEQLAPYMKDQGWQVVVYCQADNPDQLVTADQWQGIDRIHVTPHTGYKIISGAFGTILFDVYCFIHALFNYRKAVWLTLGYNTSFLNILAWILRIRQIINMDGMEWQRDKWGKGQKLYLRLAYFIAGLVADKLVADHPEIRNELEKHFKPKKITTIAYGSPIGTVNGKDNLGKYNLEAQNYCLIIARPVPENGVLEIIKLWSALAVDMKLMIVGRYDPDNPYQKEALKYQSENILFAGPIYNREILNSLRGNCYVYFHGYRVGGTNPSLVEALASGAAIIAHDNRFNRWVAGDAGIFYKDQDALEEVIGKIKSKDLDVDALRKNAITRHKEEFQWPPILEAYHQLIKSCS